MALNDSLYLMTWKQAKSLSKAFYWREENNNSMYTDAIYYVSNLDKSVKGEPLLFAWKLQGALEHATHSPMWRKCKLIMGPPDKDLTVK